MAKRFFAHRGSDSSGANVVCSGNASKSLTPICFINSGSRKITDGRLN